MSFQTIKSAGFFALFILCITPGDSQAQVAFGFRGGLNASTISFDNLPNKTERLGYHLGLFAEVPLIPNFLSVQPEVSFSVKGTSFKPLTERRHLDLNYVDLLVPVAFKLSAFDLQVGPFVSYLISTADYEVYDNTTVVIGAFKKLDAGLTAGLSYNFSRFFIGVRYNQGLMDITEDNARVFLSSGKNAVAQASLGIRF